VVVDNGGKLRQESFINPRHTVPVQLLQPPSNLGVGPSWNLLAREFLLTEEDLLLICGDDVTLHSDTIEKLVQVAHVSQADFVIPDQSRATMPQAFSCFMVRKSLFEKVGYFDERFWPAYFEDNDFHRRMKIAGAVEAVAPCGYDHLNSGTLKAYSKQELDQHHVRFRACRDYYIEKWGGLPGEERFNEPFNGNQRKVSF
jgi:GT2 family glycosyltransferase